MTKKQGLTVGLFFIVLGIIVGEVVHVFGMPVKRGTWNVRRFHEFYDEPENTWDCVLIGTSCVDRGWAAPLAWDRYGITAYSMATDSQPIILTTGLLEEVRKTQDVKLAVVDIRGARLKSLCLTEAEIRRVTDAMKYSENRQKMVKKAVEFYKDFYASGEAREAVGDEGADEMLAQLDEASMYIPFLKYHSRWKTGLNRADFVKPVSEMKGVYDHKNGPFKVREVEVPKMCADDAVELLDIQKEVLDEILAYGKETGLNLLFTSMPASMDKKQQAELNAILRYLKEKGAAVLNFNTEEKYRKIGLDFSEDFYNANHMNSHGSVKFTEYLAGYLKEAYDFENKWGGEEYDEWSMAYEKYVKFYETGWGL